MPGHRRRRADAESRGERGSIIVALLLIMCLSAVVLSSMVVAGVEHELSTNTFTEAQAFAFADSGIEHAMHRLRQPRADVAGMLLGTDGKAGTDDDGQLFGKPIIVGDGGYMVQIIDNDDGDGNLLSDTDGILQIVSTGFSRTSGRRVRVDVAGGPAGGWTPPGGVVAENMLVLDDDVSLRGPLARGFSNTAVLVDDRDVIVDGSLESAGKLSLERGVTIAGETLDEDVELREYELAHARATPVDIPDIKPADFEPHTDYRFSADGRVYGRDGSVVFDTEDGSTRYGSWQFKSDDPPIWKLKDGKAADGGALYFETAVTVDGAGQQGDPIGITIVSDKSIDIDGDTYMSATVPGLLAVAGGDFFCDCDHAEFRGSLLAREQATLKKSLRLYGSLIVQDAADLSDLIARARSGTSETLIKNGVEIWAQGVSIPFPGGTDIGYRVLSWREEPMGHSTIVYKQAADQVSPGYR